MGGEVKMKDKECPLNRDYYCDDRCKWYFEQFEACGLIWNFGKIASKLEALDEPITNTYLKEIRKSRGGVRHL